MAVTNKGAGQGQGSGAGGQGAAVGGWGQGARSWGPGAGGREPGISPGYLYNKHDLPLLWKKTRGEKNIKGILVYCISQTTWIFSDSTEQ